MYVEAVSQLAQAAMCRELYRAAGPPDILKAILAWGGGPVIRAL